MDFFRQGNDIKIKLDIGNDVNPVYFYQGQIYCNGNDKGKCLDAFFKWIEMYPRHIVMVDDKAKHLERVKTALQDRVKKFTGLRYSFLDAKAATVDMEKARIQLNEIYDQLPVEARIAIDKLNIKTYRFPKTIFNPVDKREKPVEIVNKVVHHF